MSWKCRHCYEMLTACFVDLGFAPPSNQYLKDEDLSRGEMYLPLKVRVCEKCWLVQTEDYSRPSDIFNNDYSYFSSTSKGWLNHAAEYADLIIQKLNLNENSFVVEIASNDGYLLKNFIREKIPSLGIEPASATAAVARINGVEVLEEFFSAALAKKLVLNYKKADLIIGNNVYAHVPDINDFTEGVSLALNSGGVVTFEFPHVFELIRKFQFDTIYHEHFSYLSLFTVVKIFKKYGLKIWDVDRLNTHGGSLRVYGCHLSDQREVSPKVDNLLLEEANSGLQNINTYTSFQHHADYIKNNLLKFLIDKKNLNQKVVAYGAAAKGSTLLNFSGVKKDLIPYVCDAAQAKQGKYLPGNHIPILPPSTLLEDHDIEYLLILPWNISEEVMKQNAFLVERGVKFVTAIPDLRIY